MAVPWVAILLSPPAGRRTLSLGPRSLGSELPALGRGGKQAESKQPWSSALLLWPLWANL